MENKKIDVLFGLVVIAFLVVTIFLFKEFNTRRVNDYKEYSATLNYIVKMKNNKIKVLYGQLVAQQKENDDLKNALANTRNDLDALSRKLAQQAAAVPASMPVPVAVQVPVAVTK